MKRILRGFVRYLVGWQNLQLTSKRGGVLVVVSEEKHAPLHTLTVVVEFLQPG